jgi:hypothetical protein
LQVLVEFILDCCGRVAISKKVMAIWNKVMALKMGGTCWEISYASDLCAPSIKYWSCEAWQQHNNCILLANNQCPLLCVDLSTVGTKQLFCYSMDDGISLFALEETGTWKSTMPRMTSWHQIETCLFTQVCFMLQVMNIMNSNKVNMHIAHQR